MDLKQRSARSITQRTVGAKHSDLISLAGQFDEILEKFSKQYSEQSSYVKSLRTSLEAKKVFLRAVQAELTDESITAANAVLEQAEALLESEQGELNTIDMRITETRAYANRVKSVLSNIEVERFRESSQRSINAANNKKNFESRTIAAPPVLDSETSLEKDIRLLTHQITAFIEISGK